MAPTVDAGVIADEPSTSSSTEEFGLPRDRHTSLSRYVTAVWNNLRSSRTIDDVDIQFQTTEYNDEMTMDSLIEGSVCTATAILHLIEINPLKGRDVNWLHLAIQI